MEKRETFTPKEGLKRSVLVYSPNLVVEKALRQAWSITRVLTLLSPFEAQEPVSCPASCM